MRALILTRATFCIEHRAYSAGISELLEYILIKQFTSGMCKEQSRIQIILKNSSIHRSCTVRLLFRSCGPGGRTHSLTAASSVGALSF